VKPAIAISVHGGNWGKRPALRSLVGRAVSAAISVAALQFPRGAELSIVLTDDAGMTRINGHWRGKEKPTNVLSFPGSQLAPGDAAGPVLGDIVLARETIEREAALEGKPIDDHVLHLVIHGFLHLFGYDHDNEADATLMENLESRALAALGVKDPYAD
jgi:probable rRNA maturation factor